MRPHLASLVEEFRKHPAEIAVVAHRGNRRYATSYSELANLAGRFAAELDRRSVAPGERVVLWGENSAEWIGAFFGCLLRGVIAVPLDAAGSSEFAARVIADVAPRLIVGDADLIDLPEGPPPRLTFSRLRDELPVEPLFAVSDAVNQQTAFQIVFTSGTTSEPRGIVHTHRNVLVTLQPIENEIAKYRKYERWVHPLRFLHSLPLSHVFGQFMGLWIPAILAAEVHFAEQLDPGRITELIRRERISVFIAVPRIQELLRGHLLASFPMLTGELERSAGLSIGKRWWRFRRVHRALGWKFWAVISGGATLPPELESFWNGLGFALIQGYGMTETAALVTLNHPFRIAPGTIGKPLPGREVKITDEGEILVRGDMLSGATWQGGSMRLREGEWLATGDLAEKSASGELRFLGRKGDVIVTGAGMNVHPADLESAMMQQPGVRGCVVVPCEFAGGAEPVAVALFSGGDEQLQAAVAQANRGLAEFQQIRRVLRWPELQFPYTSTGKLIRRQVTQWACDKLAGRERGTAAAAPGGDALLELIAEVTGEPASARGPNDGVDSLRLSEDLHLDSLGRVQLQSALEQRFGIELEDDAIAGVVTLGELRAMVEGGVVESQPVGAAAGPSQEGFRSDRAAVGQSADAETSEHLYPRWPWSWPVQAIRVAFIELAMRPLVWLLGAPRVARETANLPDGPLLAAYWLITALFNVFPLPRARGFRRSFAHAGEAMDRGYSVLIFPEGTRSRDGKMHSFRAGIGLLAQQSRVPILPVALIGLGELRAARSRWFRSGRLAVHVGVPVPFEEGADPSQLAERLEQTVRSLMLSKGDNL